MLLSMNTQHSHAKVRIARCPTCETRTEFSYAGEQRWPARIAELNGIDPVVKLWHCGCCHSTVSERDLKQ